MVAISNQVRQRNECYKQLVKGFMLRKRSNKGMGRDVLKWPKTIWNISFYYISNVKGLKKALVNFGYMTPVKMIYSGPHLLTDRETNGQMDERKPPSLRFCPFLNIPDSSKWKNPESFYTRTIKAVHSI